MEYQGFHTRVLNDHGNVGAVVFQEKEWRFTGWGFKSEKAALIWARRQIEDVFLGRVR